MTVLLGIEHVARARRGVLLRVDGRLGEASPLPGRSRESLEEVMQSLTFGGDALASIDFARWTLEATPGRGTIRSQVLLDDPASAVDDARAAIARGESAFKLKLRTQSESDVLAELRRALPDARLRVDANRAFPREHDVPWDALAAARVEWIEEPCPGAGALRGAPIPIALDESVLDEPERALDDLASGRVAALVLKPMLLGATETLRIGARCRSLGGRVIVSHAFESDVGRSAAEELARRLAPHETHGLGVWRGIEAWRLAASGAPLATASIATRGPQEASR